MKIGQREDVSRYAILEPPHWVPFVLTSGRLFVQLSCGRSLFSSHRFSNLSTLPPSFPISPVITASRLSTVLANTSHHSRGGTDVASPPSFGFEFANSSPIYSLDCYECTYNLM